MKIRELIIYGYGQFTRRHIVLEDAPASLFFGQNEAGKSTIMSFIHSILFGLPHKQQADSKYEPKNGEVFGGAIVAEINGAGIVKIERVRGKAGGEAIISLPGGRMAGEALLREWTGGVDKSFFQSVFSFDLHGLQQIERLSEEEIGKFLYVTSMVGTDAIYKLEQKLGKEQDRLFKPNGKKPELNEKLARLKRADEMVKDSARRAGSYQPPLREKAEADEEIRNLESQLMKRRKEQSYLNKAVSLVPLLTEEKALNLELSLLPDTSHFPADGISRLERLLSELDPLKVQTSRMEEQLRVLKEKAAALIPDKSILESEKQIQELKESAGSYQSAVKEIRELKRSISLMDDELSALSGQVYESAPSPEQFLKMDTTLKMKHTISEMDEKARTLSIQKTQLDEQFDRAKEALDLSESRFTALLEKAMSTEERADLERELAALQEAGTKQDAGKLRQELDKVSSELERHKKSASANQKSRMAGFMLLFLIAAAGVIWSFSQQQWVLASILIVILAAGGLFFRNWKAGSDPLALHLEERKRSLTEELRKHTEPSAAHVQRAEELKGLLWKDEQMKQMADLEKLRGEQEERACDRIIAKYEEWEKTRFQLNEWLMPVLNSFYLNKETTASTLMQSFQLIEQYKAKLLEKQKKEEQMKRLLSETALFEEKAERIVNGTGMSGDSLLQQIDQVSAALRHEEEKKRALEEIGRRMTELTEEYEEQALLMRTKNEAIRHLLDISKVQDEEAFRQMALHHQKREAINQQLTWISRQLQSSEIAQSMAGKEWNSLEDDLAEAVLEAEGLEKRLKTRQEDAAMLQARLEALEADGSLSEHLHEYELQKEEARATAKEWMVQTLAKDFLLRTIDYHRTVRMPKLLEQTVHFFARLTEGRYVNVYLPDREQTFIAERADGQRFKAGELSQATSEQLYLSLRLALVSTMNESLNMPVLIDDGFVHFDAGRTTKMLDILKDISSEQQVLVFTCQAHLASQFHGPVTVLERKEVANGHTQTV
ncbi:hypothetical protein CEF21_07965 [Bacillus sp. FJAT-42376]|uniref:ATP-binding protein n=1 Tax=Bacillus sp. FJAT-42376 TaxID=2014076 RepID=UPI000F4E442D|nr:AAA family ATPase [Bacillus sp. FJAT-42376]AZB42228.1 hypothetical protein CEF21_07965 [Bacillus sp. FJAT-42376]